MTPLWGLWLLPLLVVPIPFLWVLPLGLYLLSFILAFDRPRWYLRPVFLGALVVLLWLSFAFATRGAVTRPLQTLANLLSALRSEGEAETTGEDNLKTVRLVFGCYESARAKARAGRVARGNASKTA